VEAYEIIPLPDFDWHNTEPLKIRNFKAKYHLTMGTRVLFYIQPITKFSVSTTKYLTVPPFEEFALTLMMAPRNLQLYYFGTH
jgi:hypothetical protein